MFDVLPQISPPPTISIQSPDPLVALVQCSAATHAEMTISVTAPLSPVSLLPTPYSLLPHTQFLNQLLEFLAIVQGLQALVDLQKIDLPR